MQNKKSCTLFAFSNTWKSVLHVWFFILYGQTSRLLLGRRGTFYNASWRHSLMRCVKTQTQHFFMLYVQNQTSMDHILLQWTNGEVREEQSGAAACRTLSLTPSFCRARRCHSIKLKKKTCKLCSLVQARLEIRHESSVKHLEDF